MIGRWTSCCGSNRRCYGIQPCVDVASASLGLCGGRDRSHGEAELCWTTQDAGCQCSRRIDLRSHPPSQRCRRWRSDERWTGRSFLPVCLSICLSFFSGWTRTSQRGTCRSQPHRDFVASSNCPFFPLFLFHLPLSLFSNPRLFPPFPLSLTVQFLHDVNA